MFKLLILLSIFLGISNLNANNNISENIYNIKIKEHIFIPNLIEVPKDKPFKLIIENLDKTIEEFESDDLKKEKLVGANKTITININPLQSGEYKFYGDFHQKTAQGKIIVK